MITYKQVEAGRKQDVLYSNELGIYTAIYCAIAMITDYF